MHAWTHAVSVRCVKLKDCTYPSIGIDCELLTSIRSTAWLLRNTRVGSRICIGLSMANGVNMITMDLNSPTS